MKTQETGSGWLPRVLLVGVLAGPLAAGPAGSAPLPEEERPDEILMLVKDLGHPDPEVRAKADSALRDLGEAAIPALEMALASDDIEVRIRAECVRYEIQVAKLVEVMRRARAVETYQSSNIRGPAGQTPIVPEGARAYEEILAFGERGVRTLLEVFPDRTVDAKEVALDARLEKTVFAPGERIACKATLANRGEEPVWMRLGQLRLLVKDYQVMTADMGRKAVSPRPVRVVGAQGGGARAVGEDMARHYDFIHLAPGESFSFDVATPPLSDAGFGFGLVREDLVGCFDLSLTYDVSLLDPSARGGPSFRSRRAFRSPFLWAASSGRRRFRLARALPPRFPWP